MLVNPTSQNEYLLLEDRRRTTKRSTKNIQINSNKSANTKRPAK